MDNNEPTRTIKIKQSTYNKLHELVARRKLANYEEQNLLGDATYDGVINYLLSK